MASPRPGIAEAPQQVGRIDGAVIDVGGDWRKLSARNRRNLIDDRIPGKIGLVVDRQTRYSH
jgi:hypothetical protein